LDTGSVITKTVEPGKTKLEITDSNGLKIPNAPTFIKTFGESMAVDPGKLMAIDASLAPGKKALMAALFSAMPVEFTGQEVNAATNPCGVIISQPCGNLDELAKVHKSVEETRKKCGVEARSAEGTVQELARQLQADDEEKDWPAEAIRLESERNMAAANLQEKLQILSAANRKATQQITEERDAKIQVLQEEARAEIEGLRGAMDAAKADAQAEVKPAYDRLTAELATAREKAQQAERIAGARATVEAMRVKVREKNGEYERYSRALEGLDKLKQSKLDNLPVAGLNFDGENVLVDGVEWHNVNRAKRAEICIQLCSMQAGQLPFVVVDDLEHIDQDSREAIFKAAADAGFQVAGAVVISGQPLRVETEA
jgi:hypothetical protein